MEKPLRVARIKGTSEEDVPRILRYLPRNYDAGWSPDGVVVVFGRDEAGWTLDGYVLPRLASGLWFGEEVAA